MAVLLFGHSARARDLPRTDPDRKLILDGARGKDDVKLIVRDLYKDGDFALLCALKQEPSGGITGTDEMLDVSEWVLIRGDQRWVAYGTGGGLASSVDGASCGRAPTTRAGIIDALLETVRSELLGVMTMRRSIDEFTPLFELLERRGHTAGVPMDEAKELASYRIESLIEACKKNAPCEAEARRTLERVEVLRRNEHINALAWHVCERTGIVTRQASAFEQCLKTAAAEPACRPGLRLPRDQKILEQCATKLYSGGPSMP